MLSVCYFTTAIGKECEKYMKQGALVPDQVIEEMILTEMKKMQKDAWLLDGKYSCLWYLVSVNSVRDIIKLIRIVSHVV